jgi:hypothetical protein
MRKIKSAYKNLTEKPEGKNPLRRPRHRGEDIKMDLRKTGRNDVYWIHQAQNKDWWQALVNKLINL